MAMSISPGGVEFEEIEGSPKVVIRQNAVQAIRVFRVPDWNKWRDFVGELIGIYTFLGVVPTFTLPIPFPGFTNMLVTDVDVVPFLDESSRGDVPSTLASQMNEYTSGARVTAVYGNEFNGDDGDGPTRPDGTTLTIAGDLGFEQQSTGGRTWRWSGIPGAPVVDPDQFPGIVIPTGDVVMTWGRVPLPPWDVIGELRGKVNDNTFNRSPAGTLMFAGSRYRRQFQNLSETPLWEFEYTFREVRKTREDGSTVGWNYFYRELASGGEHWHAIENESGGPPYTSGDFNRLFQFPTVSV